MDERIVKYQEKMDKTLANLDSEFGTIRAGRANPHVLDRIILPSVRRAVPALH